MDGFLAQAEDKAGGARGRAAARQVQGQPRICANEVIGYHDARDIPNYWSYAKNYVLQDNMFESQASWSLPEHLAMVSAWSALCSHKEPENPLACNSSLSPLTPAKYWAAPLEPTKKTRYPWTDLTYLMDHGGVSWRYYVHEGIEPDCEDDEATTCAKVVQNAKTPGIWNPLADFTDVKQDGQTGNIQPLPKFYEGDLQRPGMRPAERRLDRPRPRSQRTPAGTGQRRPGLRHHADQHDHALALLEVDRDLALLG